MTALNERALEAIARAICCPDGSCPKWNSCTWKDWIPEANAAAVALHASEPDAVAVERCFRNVGADDWHYLLGKLGWGGRDRFWRAVFEELRPALANSAIRARSQP